MAEISRQDLISDEALKAPGQLADEFGKVSNVLDEIIAKGKENQTFIEQAKSIKELSKKVADLEKQQIKLTTANQQLKEAQKKQTEALKTQAEAMHILDEKMGGVIGKAKEMGKQFLALVKNPFILALVAIVATLAAIGSAMKEFLTSTGEGEDILNRQKAVWSQFFNVLKKGWSDLGKSIVGANTSGQFSIGIINGLLNAAKFAFPVFITWIDKIQKEFNKTAQEASDLADLVDEIDGRMAKNLIRRAETERDYNKLSLNAEELKLSNQVEAVRLLELSIAKKNEQFKIDKAIAELNAEAVLREIGLKHNLTKEEINAMSFAERDAEFKGEEMKKIAEAYANVINLESAYEQEVRKNTVKVIAFKEQIRKAVVDAAMKGAEAQIDATNNAMNAEIMAVKENLAANFKARRTNEEGVFAYRKQAIEQSEKQIREIRRRYADDLVRKNIEVFEKVLLTEELNADERAAVEQKLADFRSQLYDAFYDSVVEQGNISFEQIVGIYTNLTNELGNLFSSFTERRLQEIDAEEKALTKRYEKEIELAGDNAETKDILNKRLEAEQEKLDEKRIKAQRKAAIFDKAVSATQAAIATSLAIVSMLKVGPTGIPLSIAAGITGALQVAAILAKPIPQYAEGGTTVADLILAGERGVERYETPAGKIGYTPDGPTFMRLPIGTKITTHEETMADLAARSMDVGGRQGDQSDVVLSDRIYNKLDSLENTIKNKRETHYNWTRKGLEKAFKNGESRTYFMNEFYK